VTVDVVTVGTIVGALIGVISLLLRLLVVAKDKHIAELEKSLTAANAERDLFRDRLLSMRRD
jgi:hypothetical protein